MKRPSWSMDVVLVSGCPHNSTFPPEDDAASRPFHCTLLPSTVISPVDLEKSFFFFKKEKNQLVFSPMPAQVPAWCVDDSLQQAGNPGVNYILNGQRISTRTSVGYQLR